MRIVSRGVSRTTLPSNSPHESGRSAQRAAAARAAPGEIVLGDVLEREADGQAGQSRRTDHAPHERRGAKQVERQHQTPARPAWPAARAVSAPAERIAQPAGPTGRASARSAIRPRSRARRCRAPPRAAAAWPRGRRPAPAIAPMWGAAVPRARWIPDAGVHEAHVVHGRGQLDGASTRLGIWTTPSSRTTPASTCTVRSIERWHPVEQGLQIAANVRSSIRRAAR
jgi:hypothetical protein